MQSTPTTAMQSLVQSMTVRQLAEVVGLPIEEVVDRVFATEEASTPTPRKATQAKKAPADQAPKKNGAKALAPQTWNTRSKVGRESLDRAILDALGDKQNPKRASQVRSAIGGTAAQIRTRLNELIEQGKVGYSGRASATKYWRE